MMCLVYSIRVGSRCTVEGLTTRGGPCLFLVLVRYFASYLYSVSDHVFYFFPISPSVLRAVLCGSRSFQTSHINLHSSGLWPWFLFASHPPFTAQGLDPDKCVRTIRRYYSLSYEHTYISIRVSLGGSKIYAPQIRCRGYPLAYRTQSRP